jgi:hypothetical protein
MLDFKKNLYIAGVFVLCAFYACSSDNPSWAGSTTIPNATAENNFSSSEVGSSSSNESSSSNVGIHISFTTKATAMMMVENAKIEVYGEENGAQASCSVDGKGYSASMKVDGGVINQHLELNNMGSLCDSILQDFIESCSGKAMVFNSDSTKESCDKGGNVDVVCFNDPTTIEPTQDFDSILRDFSQNSGKSCNAIAHQGMGIFGWGQVQNSSSSGQGVSSSNVDSASGSIIILGSSDPIDTASFTLDKYTAQFTDNPDELSFDSHVLAYNGTLSPIIIRDIITARSYAIGEDNFVKEISAEEVPDYFPLTTAVAGERLNPGNCKLFVVVIIDSNQPTGHVLTDFSKGLVEISEVKNSGLLYWTDAIYPVAFLARDCDGLINTNFNFLFSHFQSTKWIRGENPESVAMEAYTYGEWYRADLAK